MLEDLEPGHEVCVCFKRGLSVSGALLDYGSVPCDKGRVEEGEEEDDESREGKEEVGDVGGDGLQKRFEAPAREVGEHWRDSPLPPLPPPPTSTIFICVFS